MKRQLMENEVSTSRVSKPLGYEYDGKICERMLVSHNMQNENLQFSNCNNITFSQQYNKEERNDIPFYSIKNLDELPYKSDLFIGRKTEMEKLCDLFKTYKSVLITGMAGFGKTHLAIECAKQWIKEGKYSQACIINVEFESEAKEKLEIVKRKLSSESEEDTLVILDNIANTSNIKELLFIIKVIKNINILGTSQINEFKQRFHQFNLCKLKRNEAVELVKGLVNESHDLLQENGEKEALLRASIGESDHQLIQELVDKLDYHPLAIRHATILIIDNTIYSTSLFSEFIKKYLKQLKENLDADFPDESNNTYNKTTYISIKLNIEKATKKDHVRDILYCTCFMDPSNIYLLEFFNIFESEEVMEVQRILKKHSIINVDVAKHWAPTNFHRLVRLVCLKLIQAQTLGEYVVKMVFKLFFHNSKTLQSDSMLVIKSKTTTEQHLKFLLETTSFAKQTLAKIYIELFRNTPELMEFLTNQLNLVELGPEDIKSWSASHYCLFARNNLLFQYFYEKPSNGWPFIFVKLLTNPFLKIETYQKQMLFEKRANELTLLKLYVACGYDFNEFKHLLHERIGISCVPFTEEDKNSLLTLATRNKKYDFGYELIKNGASYDSIRLDKAFICAVAGQNLGLAEQLIKSGANVNFTDDEGASSIYYAIYGRSPALFYLIVQNMPSLKFLEWQSKMVECKNHFLLWFLKTKRVDQFINLGCTDVLETCHNLRTLERVANGSTVDILEEKDALEIVNFLISSNASINNDIDGVTPLMLALERKFESVALKLIDVGANLNKVAFNLQTPLIFAINSGLEMVALKLIDKGVEINQRDIYGKRPLQYAVEAGLVRVQGKLVEMQGKS